MSLAPLVMVAFLMLRAVLASQGSGGGRRWLGGGTGSAARVGGNVPLTTLSSGDPMRVLVTLFVIAPAACAGAPGWFWAAMAPVVGVLFFPSWAVPWMARWVPPGAALLLGQATAPHAARLGEAGWATVAALSGGRPLSPKAAARFVKELRVTARPGPWHLLGEAALAEATGDDLRARRLMFVLADLPPGGLDPLPARRARQWCMARAGVRGDWERVQDLVVTPGAGAPERRVAAVLQGLAAGRRPSRWTLLLVAWEQRSGALARLAWSLPHGEPEPWSPPDPPAGTPALEAALWLHRQLVLQWPTEAAVRKLGAAWDPLPSDAVLVEQLTARARAVGMRPTPGPEGEEPRPLGHVVLNSLWSSMVAATANVYARVHCVPPPEGETCATLRRGARDAMYRELEDALAAVAPPARRPTREDPAGAWERWQAIRDAAEPLAWAGERLERGLVFETVFSPVLDWSVWLFNEEKQQPLAHAVMMWLLALGDEVGSEQHLDLLRRNVQIGWV